MNIRKSVDIPPKELRKLQMKAVLKGLSIKAYLEEIIIEHAKKQTLVIKSK